MRDVVKVGVDPQVLPGGKLVEMVFVVGDVTEPRLDGGEVTGNVVAQHGDVACAWHHLVRQTQERSCLAGAVGPEQTEDLARPDAEGEVIDGHKGAVANGQVFDVDDVSQSGVVVV